MTITNRPDFLIHLIHSNCNQASEWATKNDNDTVNWFCDIVRKDSEDIYHHLLSVSESDKEYNDDCEKLEKIYSFFSNFILDLKDNVNKPFDVILWNYFQCITKEKEREKFEINENYEIKGHRVSDYGIKHDRLDYETLQKLVGNTVWNSEVPYRFDPWEFIKKPQNFNDWGDAEIDAWYIIDEDGARLLENFTDELLIFNPELEMYVWAWINRDFNEHPDLGVPNDKTNFTKNSPNRLQAADSPLHKKSPLSDHRPKLLTKSQTQTETERARNIITCPLYKIKRGK